MPLPAGLAETVQTVIPAYRDQLAEMVNVDCGSYTPAGVNRIADLVATRLTELGATVERVRHQPDDGERQLGDLVIGRLAGSGPRLLLIGHMDTVFDPGTAAARPFAVVGDRATGPRTPPVRRWVG